LAHAALLPLVAGGLALATYEGERLLSTKAVIAITSLSRTEINGRIKSARFPKPIAIGTHRIAFRKADRRAYVSRMIRGEQSISTSLWEPDMPQPP
jgi:predicted DNA-binding transcriptional regulator AlpA